MPARSTSSAGSAAPARGLLRTHLGSAALDLQLRQFLQYLLDSRIRHLSVTDVQNLQFGQPFEVFDPGIRDGIAPAEMARGSVQRQVPQSGQLLQMLETVVRNVCASEMQTLEVGQSGEVFQASVGHGTLIQMQRFQVGQPLQMCQSSIVDTGVIQLLEFGHALQVFQPIRRHASPDKVQQAEVGQSFEMYQPFIRNRRPVQVEPLKVDRALEMLQALVGDFRALRAAEDQHPEVGEVFQ